MSAISRSQLAKELEPGLNALFGLEYDRYENEHAEIFDEESSDRAFEEEVMLAGFSTAPTKKKEALFPLTQRRKLSHATISRDNRSAFLSQRKLLKIIFMMISLDTKALARSMAQTKQIKAAAILNNAFSSSSAIGDGAALCSLHIHH